MVKYDNLTKDYTVEIDDSPYHAEKVLFQNLKLEDGSVYIPSNFLYWNQIKKMLNKGKKKSKQMFDLGQEPITVHLVAHSHLDPGWIKTFKQYYEDEVRDILINLIDELSTPGVGHKKFTWCETSFLSEFMQDSVVDLKDKDLKPKLRQLIQDGMIEIVGGGWVQHDEVLTHFKQQIHNMEAGMSELERLFPDADRSKVQTLWQIDPFGDSNLTPLLFSHDYKYILLNRIGDKVKEQIRGMQGRDFFWRSPFNPERGLLTHVTNIHYSTEQK